MQALWTPNILPFWSNSHVIWTTWVHCANFVGWGLFKLTQLLKNSQFANCWQTVRPYLTSFHSKLVAKCYDKAKPTSDKAWSSAPRSEMLSVEKAEICANESLWCTHSAYIDVPVSLTEQFKCSHVCLRLEHDEVSQYLLVHRGVWLRCWWLLNNKLFCLLHWYHLKPRSTDVY